MNAARLTSRRLLEMRYGLDVLSHRIGEDESLCIEQLPNPSAFSHHDNAGDTVFDACRCGTALAESFCKLIRPSADEALSELNDGFGFLAEYVEAMPSRDMRLGFLSHLELLLEIALLCPARLPAVAARLDALDVVQLQEQATKAFCWEPVGDRPDGAPIYFGDDGGMLAGLLGGD